MPLPHDACLPTKPPAPTACPMNWFSADKSSSKLSHRHDENAQESRDVVDPMFGRLKGFKRLAAHDNRADSFLSAILLDAAIAWHWVTDVPAEGRPGGRWSG
jgi:hypothetical protein